MEKKYKWLDTMLGSNLEGVVSELIAYREKGILAGATFNGQKLYSDTVTLDGAYLQVTGRTRKQFILERMEKAEAEAQLLKAEKDRIAQVELEHQTRIPELTEYWMAKGREVLAEEKWKDWDLVVPARLKDLYKGEELPACLEIIQLLHNNCTLKEAHIALKKQKHSQLSSTVVTSLVREFSERGKEFFLYVN